MNFLKKGMAFFILDEEEKNIFRTEISPENVRRVFFLSFLGALITISQIFVFAKKMSQTDGLEFHWARNIAMTHSTIAGILLLIFFILYFAWYRQKKLSLATSICINIFVLVLLTGGALISAMDQLVTSSITPFVLTSMIAALVLISRPLLSLLYYTMAYILFYFTIGIFQVNDAVIVSNQSNGLFAAGVGLALSFFLWSGTMIRYKQKSLIEKQNSDLTEAAASRDKFFSILAHDLKSPMTTIIGFLEVMKDTIRSQDTEKSMQYHKIVEDTSKQTLSLLENLLEWSRSQSGRLKYEPDLIDLVPLIRERIYTLNGQLTAKNLKINFNPQGEARVYADSEMIKTVIRNLLVNAIKFSYPNNHIEVRTESIRDHLLISVEDFGIGMDEEKISRLFNLETTFISEGTAHEHGSGLGLILCKEIVEKHNGTITVKSEPDKGSTFSFALPHSQFV